MINFQLHQAALLTWWTGFGMQAQMRDQKRDFVRPDNGIVQAGNITGACVYLKVLGVRQRGVDEIRYTVSDEDPLKGDPEVTGNRELTISCLVESYIDEPNRNAVFLCERGRTRLRMPSVEMAFEAAGMGVIEATPTIDLAYKVDGRVFSRASFDLRVNVNASEKDEPFGIIETVLVSSDWKGTDGELLPLAHQLVDAPITDD